MSYRRVPTPEDVLKLRKRFKNWKKSNSKALVKKALKNSTCKRYFANGKYLDIYRKSKAVKRLVQKKAGDKKTNGPSKGQFPVPAKSIAHTIAKLEYVRGRGLRV
jgi:hypothetical protein